MSTFSVVIPWCNRPEIEQTLAANTALFERHGAEVVILNCDGDPDALAEILRHQRITRLRHVYLPGVGFNRPLARNLGALCCTGTYLMLLDADITLTSDLFRQAARKLERGDCYVQVRKVNHTEPVRDPALSFLSEVLYTQHLVMKDGRIIHVKTRSGRDGSGCGPGLLTMRHEHLVGAGGFNSALVEWGHEDHDLQVRLQVVMRLSVKLTGEVMHLSHGDDKRASRGENLKAAARRNMLVCAENYGRGDFHGTYQEDARLWRDKLREMPAIRPAAPRSHRGRKSAAPE
jgi:glycosyltransferase involved in cell wall biosynthesis